MAADGIRLRGGLDRPRRLPFARWREPRLLPGGCPTGIEVADRGAWRRVSDDAARGLCALRVSSWAPEQPGDTATFARPLLKARTLDGRAALLRIHADAVEATAADLVNSKP